MLNQFLFSDFVSIFYQTISCHLLVYISLYQNTLHQMRRFSTTEGQKKEQQDS